MYQKPKGLSSVHFLLLLLSFTAKDTQAKFIKLHKYYFNRKKKVKSLRKTHPNNYLRMFPQEKTSQLKWQSSRGLFSTCWNGWISYAEQKWLFCLQFMESWDSSPHLGAAELWQSVTLELFLHAPRSRAVVLLSVYSRNCLNYFQWTEGQHGESKRTLVQCHRLWSCQEKEQIDSR